MTQRILTIAGRELTVETKHSGSRWLIQHDDRTDDVNVVSIGEFEAVLEIEGKRYVVPYFADGRTVSFFLDGEVYSVEVTDRSSRSRSKEHSMTAPMPGVVLRIAVSSGDTVSRGTPLMVLEAMKMEHVIASPRDGVVGVIHCAVGDLVQPGVELITVDDAVAVPE